jgi:(p)ppGpp synthase/HD superfamily hydrolase
MEIIEKARIFAVAAHSAIKQVRKYTNEPYWVHPQEVADIVASVPGATENMIAAAHLHDTVEDTGVTIEVIRAEFGIDIATLVGWLTDVSKPEDGNRAHRKAIDRAYTAEAPAEAQTIKCADLRANTISIAKYDPAFAKTYLAEKREMLAVMTKAHPVALKMAYDALEEAEASRYVMA